jgi:hypothetical protein
VAKALVVIENTYTLGQDEAFISYSVSVIKTGAKAFSYVSDYQVNTAITLNNNLIAWWNRVIAQAAEKGVVLSASDVIVFGAPS